MKAAQLFDVGGRVAVVTGGAGGLGRAYAEAMLDNGAEVMLLDRDAGRARPRRDGAGAAGAARRWPRGRRHRSRGAARRVRPGGRAPRPLDIVFANVGIDAGPGFLSGAGERVAAGAIEAIPTRCGTR
jgi:NAD(P)-dependent dehydrogenase (short-subunit alcohol dehydrogenase family)